MAVALLRSSFTTLEGGLCGNEDQRREKRDKREKVSTKAMD